MEPNQNNNNEINNNNFNQNIDVVPPISVDLDIDHRTETEKKSQKLLTYFALLIAIIVAIVAAICLIGGNVASVYKNDSPQNQAIKNELSVLFGNWLNKESFSVAFDLRSSLSGDALVHFVKATDGNYYESVIKSDGVLLSFLFPIDATSLVGKTMKITPSELNTEIKPLIAEWFDSFVYDIEENSDKLLVVSGRIFSDLTDDEELDIDILITMKDEEVSAPTGVIRWQELKAVQNIVTNKRSQIVSDSKIYLCKQGDRTEEISAEFINDAVLSLSNPKLLEPELLESTDGALYMNEYNSTFQISNGTAIYTQNGLRVECVERV
jgi:hypothetical protein